MYKAIFKSDFGSFTEKVELLARELGKTAAIRDKNGGTAFAERKQIRQSGLLKLSIPKEYGGLGADWSTIFKIIRRLAEEDSSLAHLFGFQHLQIATILLFGSKDQKNNLLQLTADNNWFWGNAVNSRDTRLTASQIDESWVLNGIKSFCSGCLDSDAILLTASDASNLDNKLYIAIPSLSHGVTINDDWDNMGQRQTDSGTVEFKNVTVKASDILNSPGPSSSPWASLRNMIGQIILTEIYIGNAQGALSSAIDYNQHQTRPWAMSNVNSSTEDPFNQVNAGELWSKIKAISALSDQSHLEFDHSWNLGLALDEITRGNLSMTVAAARTTAAEVSLEVTSKIFELTGASSTANKNRFDRYWRNVRVHTLHDPIKYRSKEIGAWLLTGKTPHPYGYG